MKPLITDSENGKVDFTLFQEELSGGKVSKDEIDRLKKHESINKLSISGLNQDTFEYLIQHYGSKFSRLYLFKCPKIYNFSPLETLNSLQEIEIFWNQKSENLWNLEKNSNLEKIVLSDIKKLNNLYSFNNNNTLKYIEIDNGFTGALTIDTLKPLTTCQKLHELNIRINKLLDDNIFPLAEISTLNKLYFPPNLFTTEQVAWLKAKSNGKFTCDLFEGIIKTNVLYFGTEQYTPDTIIVGKRKPYLNSVKDKNKIEKYLENFNNLVEEYKSK
ncbi:MAG: hypothetical protein U0T07_07555 [Chitinophagales bacterium]